VALDAFQADVARIALDTAGEHGFALAGGNALVAHGIVQRTTEDVDLFSNEAGGPGAVTAAVQVALEAAGYQVVITRPPELSQGEFAQMLVRRGDASMQLTWPGTGVNGRPSSSKSVRYSTWTTQ
jgi:hypothetical protein